MKVEVLSREDMIARAKKKCNNAAFLYLSDVDSDLADFEQCEMFEGTPNEHTAIVVCGYVDDYFFQKDDKYYKGEYGVYHAIRAHSEEEEIRLKQETGYLDLINGLGIAIFILEHVAAQTEFFFVSADGHDNRAEAVALSVKHLLYRLDCARKHIEPTEYNSPHDDGVGNFIFDKITYYIEQCAPDYFEEIERWGCTVTAWGAKELFDMENPYRKLNKK